jgi:hypothetical protein
MPYNLNDEIYLYDIAYVHFIPDCLYGWIWSIRFPIPGYCFH